MSDTPRSGGVSRFSSAGTIAAAMGIMNVSTYGFTVVAARVLGPPAYGAFAGLMATLLVVSVLQLGLQATAARRIAADPEHVGQIQRTILGVTYRAAAALAVLLLVLSPALNAVLRLDSLLTAALVAVVSVPFTLMGGQAGILQGERRWGALSVLYLLSGVPRLLLGSGLVIWQPSELTALIVTGIGACFPIAAGWWFLRRPREPGAHSEEHGFRRVIAEVGHSAHALLALFALFNADIVVARNVLPEHDAGLYAGGLILTKAVLFLPQFVVVVAFPEMSTQAGRRRALTMSLGLVATIGLVVVGGVTVLTDLALVFVGGDEYREISDHLWIFAGLGTVLAMLQLLIYAVLARQGQGSVYLVWAAFAVMVGAGLTCETLRGLVTVVICADAALLAVMLTVSLRVTRPATEREDVNAV